MGGHVFGDYLGDLMAEKGFTLREVGRKSGIDASNLSKIERGVALPPQKRETLERLAAALELNKKERQKFLDIADLVNGQIPPDIEKLKKNECIPMLLRAIENKKLTKAQTEQLAKMISEENSWQGKVVE